MPLMGIGESEKFTIRLNKGGFVGSDREGAPGNPLANAAEWQFGHSRKRTPGQGETFKLPSITTCGFASCAHPVSAADE